MAFISYYFHWSNDQVMALDHMERRRWCRQISQINESLTPQKSSKEKSITEMRATRL